MTGDNLAYALATDPDAILDARRDSFACAACGSPDPARLYDGGCSDCRRRWAHRQTSERFGMDAIQPVDVLGWTQHGAIVIATEDGWLSRSEPSFVRVDELVLVP